MSAVDLGVVVVEAAMKRAGIKAEQVENIVGGMVYKAAAKGNPARQVAIKVGVPVEATASTVDQQCASAMRAFEIASQELCSEKKI